MHTYDSTDDDHIRIEEVAYDVKIPTFSEQLVEKRETLPFATPAFSTSVYTHKDHGHFRYDFGRSEAYGRDYKYGANGVPFGRVATYDYAGNA